MRGPREAMAGVEPGRGETGPARPLVVPGSCATRFSTAAKVLAIIILLVLALGTGMQS
ncbi:MAG TPA: hypothetical protein VEA99_00380 [Gemmatimonadaceae bacterium]|nr:hypothetical protein [Gemmatimonadaceae bacterium]